MFQLNNKIEKSEIRKISSKRLQFILALGRFVTYTFLSARGVAQLGSATALGAVGRWFESSHPDHFSFCFTLAAVVQLVEHQPSKLTVAGSSPVRRSIKFPILNYPCSKHNSEYLSHLLFLHGSGGF